MEDFFAMARGPTAAFLAATRRTAAFRTVFLAVAFRRAGLAVAGFLVLEAVFLVVVLFFIRASFHGSEPGVPVGEFAA